MSLHERIENARGLLRTGRLANEAAVSSGVVLPILDALGWPAFDPSIVAPEYGVGKRRVDFALLTNGTPAVFLEVKQPGLINGADRQLFEYAFHEGVPIAILTDGATWHVYLPAMQGSYDERRVYLLDLADRDSEESAERLQRYLAREAVESGEAFDLARRDYQRAKQRKDAAHAIPQAWANLIAEPADLLALLASEVERVSGFEADPRDLRSFIQDLRPTGGPLPEGKAPGPRPPRHPKETSPTDGSLPGVGFEIDGAFIACSRGREVLEGVFKALHARDESFLERFASEIRGRKRAYLARTTDELFPGHPELANQSVEIADGWLLSTHSSSSMKAGIIKKACDLAGARFGTDVKIQMP